MGVALLDSMTTSSQDSEDIQQQLPIHSNALHVLTGENTVMVTSGTSSSSESHYAQIGIFLESIDSLIETLDIMSDFDLMQSIQQGMQESAEGKGQDLEDVFTDLGW